MELPGLIDSFREITGARRTEPERPKLTTLCDMAIERYPDFPATTMPLREVARAIVND
jgi:hypothetical protein